MADAYTSTSALGLDQAAYDLMVRYALRPQLFFDQLATVKPTRQSMPGSSVVFRLMGDLAAATSALSETVDVDAVALTDSTVTLTLAEYGNAVLTTALMRGTSYVPLDPEVANILGFNAGLSIDTIAANIIKAGTNITYASTAVSRVTVGATMKLTAALVRQQLAILKGAYVAPFANGDYVSIIHPDVAYDLRSETGTAAWSDPVAYSDAERRWNGELGKFEGFRFIETATAPVFVNAGVSSVVDVYRTLFLGAEALAKAFSNTDGNGDMPRVVVGNVTDKLKRFVPMGWYWLGAYGIFRQAAVRAVESSSSIANNVS